MGDEVHGEVSTAGAYVGFSPRNLDTAQRPQRRAGGGPVLGRRPIGAGSEDAVEPMVERPTDGPSQGRRDLRVGLEDVEPRGLGKESSKTRDLRACSDAGALEMTRTRRGRLARPGGPHGVGFYWGCGRSRGRVGVGRSTGCKHQGRQQTSANHGPGISRVEWRANAGRRRAADVAVPTRARGEQVGDRGPNLAGGDPWWGVRGCEGIGKLGRRRWRARGRCKRRWGSTQQVPDEYGDHA